MRSCIVHDRDFPSEAISAIINEVLKSLTNRLTLVFIIQS